MKSKTKAATITKDSTPTTKSHSHSNGRSTSIFEMASLQQKDKLDKEANGHGHGDSEPVTTKENKLPVPVPTSLSVHAKSTSQPEMNRVSDWFDTDGFKTFMKTVRDGDIVELRNGGTSHWGIARRIKQSSSPNGKVLPDEVMIYHLIHSPTHRGQIGQYTIEEFWKSDCRIRINNTTNGMSLYGNSQPISRTDVLKNAFTAHLSTSLKWQTCSDFIRWSCQDCHDLNNSASKSMSKSSSSANVTS